MSAAPDAPAPADRPAIRTAKIYKQIPVTVDLHPFEILHALTVEELREEYSRRNLHTARAEDESCDDGDGEPDGVDAAAIDQARACLARGDVAEALAQLEKALWDVDQTFRGLAAQVTKHFCATAPSEETPI